MNTVIVGLGYVGLPLALRAVEVGQWVTGLDVSRERVGALQQGRSYVDDISDDELARAHDTGRFRVVLDYDELGPFDVAVVTVPTPLRERSPDLSFVEDAARSLAAHLTPGALVILESTTYPGTTEEHPRPAPGEGQRAGGRRQTSSSGTAPSASTPATLSSPSRPPRRSSPASTTPRARASGPSTRRSSRTSCP